MAKKDKMKKKIKEEKTEDRIIQGLFFDDFRIIKADDLNWSIEKKNEKGNYDGTKRRYYPKLKSAIESAFEKMILNDNDASDLKGLSETIERAKETLSKELNRLRLERPDIDVN